MLCLLRLRDQIVAQTGQSYTLTSPARQEREPAGQSAQPDKPGGALAYANGSFYREEDPGN